MKIRFSGGRRSFMKHAAIFGGFAAFLGLVGPSALRRDEIRPAEEEPKKGYRLTEHVKRYYEMARG